MLAAAPVFFAHAVVTVAKVMQFNYLPVQVLSSPIKFTQRLCAVQTACAARLVACGVVAGGSLSPSHQQATAVVFKAVLSSHDARPVTAAAAAPQQAEPPVLSPDPAVAPATPAASSVVPDQAVSPPPTEVPASPPQVPAEAPQPVRSPTQPVAVVSPVPQRAHALSPSKDADNAEHFVIDEDE
jgi:hypothetical protein